MWRIKLQIGFLVGDPVSLVSRFCAFCADQISNGAETETKQVNLHLIVMVMVNMVSNIQHYALEATPTKMIICASASANI